MRIALRVLATAALLSIAAAPAAATEAPERTRLAIETDEHAQQGEPHEVTLVLTDARGDPLAGQPITVREQIRFFDYTDTVPIDEVRTDHRGAATMLHTPTTPGPGRLFAEFAGDDVFAAASATAAMQIEEGVSVPTVLTQVRPEPLLPRGVTAVWFVPLLLGVWLAISSAVYQLVCIPGARTRSRDA